MATRYKQDAQRELSETLSKIASHEKMLAKKQDAMRALDVSTPKGKFERDELARKMGISTAVLPNLERTRDALRAEIATLPERPLSEASARPWRGTNFSFNPPPQGTGYAKGSPEWEALAIPEQFKRDAANRLPGHPDYGKPKG